jgi:hypothetical protein
MFARCKGVYAVQRDKDMRGESVSQDSGKARIGLKELSQPAEIALQCLRHTVVAIT